MTFSHGGYRPEGVACSLQAVMSGVVVGRVPSEGTIERTEVVVLVIILFGMGLSWLRNAPKMGMEGKQGIAVFNLVMGIASIAG